MRKKVMIFCLAFLAGAGSVFVPEAFPVYETGSGARSLGFAGNFIAVADDPSAAYWNPAGLSFLNQREVFGGVGFIGQVNDIKVLGEENRKSVMRLCMSPIGFLYPVPVDRGGFSLSLSVSNPFNFDDILKYSISTANSQGETVATDSDFRMYGGLTYWTAAGGLQVGPGVGLGVALSLISGHENAHFVFLRTTAGRVIDTAGDDFDDHYKRDYLGVEARGGLLFRPDKNIRIGLRVVLPRSLSFDESVKSTSPAGSTAATVHYGIKGDLLSSFEGAAGAAYQLYNILVSAEVRGRIPYALLQPIEDIPDESDAAHIKAGFGGGVEFPLVSTPLTGRAAYSYDEYDTHRFTVQYDGEDPDFNAGPSDTEENIHSFGAGVGINYTQFIIDLGYRIGWYRLFTNRFIRETRTVHQAELALRWRF